jgi:NADPH:quinone reductase-like Zn-dependent oxidoreductase
MRAVVYDHHGGSEVLRYTSVPDPRPGPVDVVVRVSAAALNRLDVVQRFGWFTMPGFNLPHIAGMDVAGVIQEVGSEVDGLAVGDRVVIDPSLAEVPAGSTYANMGDLYGVLGIIGATVDGGYSELCLAPSTHVHRVPDAFSLADAATVPTAYATAWHALVEIGRLQAGETILIHAAASGVSSAAIQLAKSMGAIVLATAGSDEKLAWATELGANHVVNNRVGNVIAFAKDMTNGAGVDIVFDHVGPAQWEPSVFSLKPRGRLVFAGNTTGNDVPINLGYAYHMGITFMGSDPYRYEEFGKMLDAVWNGGFRSIIDSQVPLEDAGPAQERMLAFDFMGKILLIP